MNVVFQETVRVDFKTINVRITKEAKAFVEDLVEDFFKKKSFGFDPSEVRKYLDENGYFVKVIFERVSPTLSSFRGDLFMRFFPVLKIQRRRFRSKLGIEEMESDGVNLITEAYKFISRKSEYEVYWEAYLTPYLFTCLDDKKEEYVLKKRKYPITKRSKLVNLIESKKSKKLFDEYYNLNTLWVKINKDIFGNPSIEYNIVNSVFDINLEDEGFIKVSEYQEYEKISEFKTEFISSISTGQKELESEKKIDIFNTSNIKSLYRIYKNIKREEWNKGDKENLKKIIELVKRD